MARRPPMRTVTTRTVTPDDEDGVTIGTLLGSPTTAVSGSVVVDLQAPNASANILNAWIDFNRDGDWGDAGEQVFTNRSLGTTAGTQTLSFTIPAGASAGTTYAQPPPVYGSGLTPTGAAANGEVEDYGARRMNYESVLRSR